MRKENFTTLADLLEESYVKASEICLSISIFGKQSYFITCFARRTKFYMKQKTVFVSVLQYE